jgi:ADP-ribose pyrophosphatase YjhB (NUDIX family)
MEIQSQFEYRGKTYKSHWVEGDPSENLENVVLHGVHAVCFCGDKIVVVHDPKNDEWTPPGGGIEQGETWQEATIREVKEESNMKVLYMEYIGYQDAWDEEAGDSKKLGREARPFCFVEPYGEFTADPDNDIEEIKLIDPKDYKQYFDWGKVGDRMMERAIEMNNKYLNNI